MDRFPSSRIGYSQVHALTDHSRSPYSGITPGLTQTFTSESEATTGVVRPEDHLTYKAGIWLWTCMSPVILSVGTLGSILSLLVLCRRSMRKQTSMFYLSVLAVADVVVLYGGFCRLWLEYTQAYYIRLESDLACKLHTFLVYVSLDFSVWVLVALSVDRCVFISWQHRARHWCTLARARVIVAVIIVVLSLVNMHFFWTYGLESAESGSISGNDKKSCFADRASSVNVRFIEMAWPWLDLCVYCVFPFACMAVSNTVIIRHILESERKMTAHSKSKFRRKSGNKIHPTEPAAVSNVLESGNGIEDSQGSISFEYEEGKCDELSDKGASGEGMKVVFSLEDEECRCGDNAMTVTLEQNAYTTRSRAHGTSSEILQEQSHDEATSVFSSLPIATPIQPVVSTMRTPTQCCIRSEKDDRSLRLPGVSPEGMVRDAATPSPATPPPVPKKQEVAAESGTGKGGACKALSSLSRTHRTSSCHAVELTCLHPGEQPVFRTARRSTMSDSGEMRQENEARDSNILPAALHHQNLTKEVAHEGNNACDDNPNLLTVINTEALLGEAAGRRGRDSVSSTRSTSQADHSNVFTICVTTSSPPASSLEQMAQSKISQELDIICANDTMGTMLGAASYKDQRSDNPTVSALCCTPTTQSNVYLDSFFKHAMRDNSFHEQAMHDDNFLEQAMSDSTLPEHGIKDHSVPEYVMRDDSLSEQAIEDAKGHNEVTGKKLSDNTDIFDRESEHDITPWLTVNKERKTNYEEASSINALPVRVLKNRTKESERNVTNSEEADSSNYKEMIRNSANIYSGLRVRSKMNTDRNFGPGLINDSINKNHSGNVTSCLNNDLSSTTTSNNNNNNNNNSSSSKVNISNNNNSADTTTTTSNSNNNNANTNNDSCNLSRLESTPPSKTRFTAQISTSSSRSSRSSTNGVSTTLVVITAVFWVLNAPIVIYIIGYSYWLRTADVRGEARLQLAWAIVNILQYSNNALHVILYCLTGPKFRRELKKMAKELAQWLGRLAGNKV